MGVVVEESELYVEGRGNGLEGQEEKKILLRQWSGKRKLSPEQ